MGSPLKRTVLCFDVFLPAPSCSLVAILPFPFNIANLLLDFLNRLLVTSVLSRVIAVSNFDIH